MNKPTKHELIKTSGTGIKGIWNINEFDAKQLSHIPDDELEKLFVDHYRKFRKGEVAEPFPLGLRPKKSVKKNTVVNGLINTIIHRMINDYTTTEDLIARKLAVGTSNVVANITNAQLGLEKYRGDFTDAFQSDNTGTFVLFVNRNTANGNESLTVADAGNTVTQFKITPGEGTLFNVGDRIRVTTTSQFNFTDIIAIDNGTSTITVSSSEPLADIPVGGEQIIQVWAEAGIFGNQTAGSSFNTGTLYNRVNQLEFVKDSSKIILIQVDFIFTPQ